MPVLVSRPIRRSVTLALALALAAGAGTACQLNFTSGIEARDQWTRTYPLSRNGSLEIRETHGRIKVEGTDGDKVEVVADRIAKGRTDEAAKEVLAGIEIKETVAPDSVTLDSTSRGQNLGIMTSRRVDYVVKVPRNARVILHSTNGDLDVSGLLGRFEGVTTNGDVSAIGIGDGAEIETTNGVVTVEASSLGKGLVCETTNGAITVTVPRDIKADLSAQTSNGHISYDGLDVTIAEKSQRRLDGMIGGGGPTIRLRTTNGPIRLRGR
jgi:DUF4097 and DUF4098 domain-containing protein YvlB